MLAYSTVSRADNFMIYGVGNVSCATYAETTEGDRDYSRISAWIAGWVSAASYYLPKELPKTDAGTVSKAAHIYCKAHPMSKIVHAAYDTVHQLEVDGH